ncbi:Bcr/CflA family efflux MFS transporter [Paenibacillus albiflavus]|uniref:Bcr/CflA family efflux transporter n=1 Tax=Paenibacillus albiflavus TaxID=2545760 RepID=A0A4R4EKF2_9BACL|nr:multidrug effflux MFS transporter [Paenibacillus albiflavus]TCZ78758.1 Bcr/CflA family efflux MFS transporter [Paenibacillus albiflavus]
MSTQTKKHPQSSSALNKKQRLAMAVTLGSMTAIGPLSLDMYLPALPILSSDLNASTSLTQFSLTACLLGLALGQLIMGALSDSRGRRVPLIASLSVYALASVLCAIVPSIWGLIVLRFIQGLAGAGGIVIARAMARDLYEGTELTKFFSLLMLVNGLAPILAPIAGGQLLKFISWHGVFIVLGFLGLLMVLGAVIGLSETLPVNRRTKGGIKTTVSTFKGLIRDRIFMGYALSQGFVSAAMFGYISGSPFVLQDIYGVSPQAFSLFFALNGLGLIIAAQITGYLAPKLGETKLFRAGLTIAVVSGLTLLGMILMKAPLIGILIPLFFVVSCTSIVGTAGFSLAMTSQGDKAGSASAMLGLLPFIFGSIAAPLVGIAGNQTAVPMGLVITFCVIGALSCYLFMVQSLVRRKSQPTNKSVSL